MNKTMNILTFIALMSITTSKMIFMCQCVIYMFDLFTTQTITVSRNLLTYLGV